MYQQYQELLDSIKDNLPEHLLKLSEDVYFNENVFALGHYAYGNDENDSIFTPYLNYISTEFDKNNHRFTNTYDGHGSNRDGRGQSFDQIMEFMHEEQDDLVFFLYVIHKLFDAIGYINYPQHVYLKFFVINMIYPGYKFIYSFVINK